MSKHSIRSVLYASLMVAAASLFTAACGSDDSVDAQADPGPSVTEGDEEPMEGCDTSAWVVVDVGEFSFSTPPDLVEQEIQGIDSLVGEYARAGMTVAFDYGWYSSDYDYLVEAGAESTPVTIENHDGEITKIDLDTVPETEGNLFLGLHVPEVEVTEESATALSMWIDYDDEADTAEATCILESVTFA